MSYLGPEAAEPFTAPERRHFERAAESVECITPVPKNAGMPRIKRHDDRQPDHVYPYRDDVGTVLGYIARWNAHNGTKKHFCPYTFWRAAGASGGKWCAKAWPTPRPLFGLDQLADHPSATVLLVEGEKKVEAIELGPLNFAGADVVGVTWPGGAKAIKHADFSPLAGRNVIMLPDNDEAGEAGADELTATLKAVGVKSLRRWKPPAVAPEKWDIADRIPDGLTSQAIVKSILEAPEVSGSRIVRTLSEFLADFVPPDYLIEGLLQHHYFYTLTGMTGAGKTAVALLIAILVAMGRKLGSREVERGRVIYIARENPTDVRMRLIGMAAKMGFDPEEIARNFLIIDCLDSTLSKDLPRIRREIEEFGDVSLVVVDTAPSVFEGDNENDNMQMLAHAKRLRRLCDLPGRPCVLALCHPIKNASSPEQLLPRGGGALLNEADGNLTVWGHDEKLTDLHWIGKYRGPDFDKITFRLPTITTMDLMDSKGRLLPTVMAQLVTADEAAEAENKGTFQENSLLAAMAKRPRGSLSEWASDCGWMLHGKPNKELARRVMNRLKKDNLVKKDGRTFVLTKAGKAEAKTAT